MQNYIDEQTGCKIFLARLANITADWAMILEPLVHTGCSGKIVFFIIHRNPSLAYIYRCKDFQSSQPNGSAQSLLLTGQFLYNQ